MPFYHVTTRSSLPSILKNGLVPSEGKVYLTSTRSNAEDVAYGLSFIDGRDSSEFVTLEVRLPKGTKLRRDLEFPSIPGITDSEKFYYTTRGIPPENVEVVQ